MQGELQIATYVNVVLEKLASFDCIVLKAMDFKREQAIDKAVVVADVVKSRVHGLHQITKISTMEEKESLLF